MARQCQITGKKTVTGHNRPFSLKATKRTFRPNLFKKRMINPETGKMERMTLCAKAIKTLKKQLKERGMLVDFSGRKPEGTPSKMGEGKHIKKEKLTPKQKKEMEAMKAEEAKNVASVEEIGKKGEEQPAEEAAEK